MKTFVILLGTAMLYGCAGGHCRVSSPGVVQPVSCTSCVFDAAGRIRTAGSQEVVRHVELSKSNWTMLWTGIPLSKRDWDISPELNAKLQETPGNAVVNVTVRAEGCNFLHWYLAALVPVIPSYVNVKVDGDIVQMNNPPL